MSHRVIMGKWPAGVGSGFGLRVARPGHDAASTDDRDLLFSSDWPAVLPVHQAGSFTLTNGTQSVISFPDLGYVPFVFFLIKPNGAPFGTPSYVPIFEPGWQRYEQIPYISATGATRLQLRARHDVVIGDYQLYQPSGNSQGWPSSFDVGYIVYRMRADV